jgi:hypothetical protein
MSTVISRSPAFQSQRIDGVIVNWKQTANGYLLGKFINVNYYNSDKIEFDIDVPQRGGATPLSAVGAEAPVRIVGQGRSRESFETPVWKEKIVVQSAELFDKRRLGSFDQLETAEQIMARKREVILERLANRMEILRKQLLFDQQIRATDPYGNPYTWSYPSHPADFRVTASATWDDVTNANPKTDLLEWVRIWKSYSPYVPALGILPKDALEKISEIDYFRDMQIAHGFDNSRQGILNYLTSWAGFPIIESGYESRISAATPLTAAIGVAGVSLVLQDTFDLEAGDFIRLQNIETKEEEAVEVASVSGSTVTLVAPGVQRAAGYVAGDMAMFYKYTIPADKMLILGARKPLPLTMTNAQVASYEGNFMSDWAEIASTRALDSSLRNPKPGIFRKVIDKTSNEEIEQIWEIIGVHAIPRVMDGKGWMVCTIF